MADAIEQLNHKMQMLQVAFAGAIADYGDANERGYLKEHPDIVAQRLGLLTQMIDQIRHLVDSERASGNWSAPQGWTPAGEFSDELAEYLAHTCTCGYCLQGTDAA